MNKHKAQSDVDMTGRLRQLEQLLEGPAVVAPRAPADDAIETQRPLLDVEPHQGRMYVAGHEPHFRTITLLQKAQRRAGPAPS